MKMIYEIVNNINTKKYIGQSKNASVRFKHHLYKLKQGKHHSKYFQNFYNKYKEQVIFTLNILYENLEQADANLLEEKLINENYEDLFNMSKKACGGDLISYHPNRNNIIKRMLATQKEMRISGKIKPKGLNLKGTDNPNYRHGNYVLISSNCPGCNLKRISLKNKKDTLCKACSFKTINRARRK